MCSHHPADTSCSYKLLALKSTGAVQWVMVPPRGMLENTKEQVLRRQQH